MSDELIPAELDLLPLGSVVPMSRENPAEGWLLFDGQTFYAESYPDLFDVIVGMNENASKLFDGWGAEIDQHTHSVKLPDIDSKTVYQMMWGVDIQGAPDLVLAMKAVRSEA